MKKIFLTGLLLFSFLALRVSAQTEQIRTVELHGDFLGNMRVDYDSSLTKVPQFGAGITTTLGKIWLGVFLEYNYTNINLKKLDIPGVKTIGSHAFYLGNRYYPMIPTFLAGSVAFRITAGAALGTDLNLNFRSQLQAGLALSPVRSTTGGTIHFVYLPGSFTAKGYSMKPCWMIRIGLLIGPSMN